MNSEKQSLLKSKLEELKKKQLQQRLDNEKKRIKDNTEDFNEKYRFASEAESLKIEEFIGQLHFTFPAHIAISQICDPVPHENMYLCFLGGSEELFRIYVFGKYSDLIKDIDTWFFFSPYLLLIDEDFKRFIYINDNGDMTESIL